VTVGEEILLKERFQKFKKLFWTKEVLTKGPLPEGGNGENSLSGSKGKYRPRGTNHLCVSARMLKTELETGGENLLMEGSGGKKTGTCRGVIGVPKKGGKSGDGRWTFKKKGNFTVLLAFDSRQ